MTVEGIVTIPIRLNPARIEDRVILDAIAGARNHTRAQAISADAVFNRADFLRRLLLAGIEAQTAVRPEVRQNAPAPPAPNPAQYEAALRKMLSDMLPAMLPQTQQQAAAAAEAPDLTLKPAAGQVNEERRKELSDELSAVLINSEF